MAKKKVRACEDDFGYSLMPHLIIEEPEEGYEFTGLLGPNGQPLHRYVANNPIGFLWHDENGELSPKHEFFDDIPDKVWSQPDAAEIAMYSRNLDPVRARFTQEDVKVEAQKIVAEIMAQLKAEEDEECEEDDEAE